ncbi:MAG: molybdate ABC transporter substrate-binding protein [Bacillales bacterium]|nr:molybdate ABC transporter substrate-binding protein [Bacillales bacterium]
MMVKKMGILMMAALLLVAAGCSGKSQGGAQNQAEEKKITVSAAASLQPVLDEIVSEFEKKHKDFHVTVNYGGSGALAQQISQGAPVDLFLSASTDNVDQLKKKNLVSKDDLLLENELVVAVPKGESSSISDMKDLKGDRVKKIAIGTPDAVPAGQYAKQTLEFLKLWNDLKSKMVYTKDVRQALSYVETGSVDAAFVYKTDALSSQKVKIAFVVNKKWHDPIVYEMAVIKNHQEKEAEEFASFLQDKHSQSVFKKYGYFIPSKEHS